MRRTHLQLTLACVLREGKAVLGNAAHDEAQFEAVVRTARALLGEGRFQEAQHLAKRSMAAFGRSKDRWGCFASSCTLSCCCMRLHHRPHDAYRGDARLLCGATLLCEHEKVMCFPDTSMDWACCSSFDAAVRCDHHAFAWHVCCWCGMYEPCPACTNRSRNDALELVLAAAALAELDADASMQVLLLLVAIMSLLHYPDAATSGPCRQAWRMSIIP